MGDPAVDLAKVSRFSGRAGVVDGSVDRVAPVEGDLVERVSDDLA